MTAHGLGVIRAILKGTKLFLTLFSQFFSESTIKDRMNIKTFLRIGCIPTVLFACAIAPMARAAVTPSLGAAATYGVLSDTYSNPTGPTTINGDVGFTTGPLVAPLGVHANYGSGAPYATAGVDQAAALGVLNSQGCTFTFVAPNVVLDTTLEHPTTYVPGVYCSTGTMSVGTAGGITLSGAGTYIFRSGGALNTVAGATVNLGPGASACDVFWTPNGATTLNANSTFVGTVIPVSQDITVLSTTNWTGRALTYGHTVTTPNANAVISVPTCPVVVPVVPSSGAPTAPLINVRKVPSPLNLPAGPGPVTYTYTVTNPGKVPLSNVTLTDDKCAKVTFISGDTDHNSQLDITEAWTYTCTTTLTQTTVNYATARGVFNDMASVDTAIAEVVVGVPVVPPLIHIIKTPSPLSLVAPGGAVVYSYVVTNPGTVALSDVTVTDDKCSNVKLVSGDANSDAKLQSNETWTYTCTATISQTTTNTAIATGHANGLTAIDTALATVVVSGSPVPPLIHVIKQASPIILPAAGGWVTYSYAVTNPGTVSLSNVTLTDDKCNGVTAISGDANGNGMLDTNESWMYTCKKYISYSTTNTATATGHANGLTVTDLAVASVAVSPALLPVVPPTPVVPKLPNTGFGPGDQSVVWMVSAAGLFVLATILFAVTKGKRVR